MHVFPFLLLPSLLVACKPGAVEPEVEPTARISDNMVTIAFVTWSTPEAADGFVEFGTDTSYGMATPPTGEVSEHAVSLLGMHADSTYHYRVVSIVDGERVEGADHTLQTGSLPDTIPDFTVLESDPDVVGYFALAFDDVVASVSGAVIVDATGAVVWYSLLPLGTCPYVERAAGGAEMLLRMDTENMADDSAVLRVSMDGEVVTPVPTPAGHHALAQVEGTQFAYIQQVFQDYEGQNVAGDQVVELGLDGTSRVVWSAWDQLTVERHQGWNLTESNGYGDWTHANGLAYDAIDDSYYLSLYWLSTVIKISRATGDTVWILGGTQSDFTFGTEGPFGRIHAPEPTPSGVLIFDNEAAGGSRARELALDGEVGAAADVWSFQRSDGREATVLGDVDRLMNGDTLIAWGDVGEASLVSESGATRWRIGVHPGIVMGQVDRIESLY
jgi:hypothetical protein